MSIFNFDIAIRRRISLSIQKKSKIKEEIEAPTPKEYLSVNSKFLDKFPKKKTVSE